MLHVRKQGVSHDFHRPVLSSTVWSWKHHTVRPCPGLPGRQRAANSSQWMRLWLISGPSRRTSTVSPR